jgi:nucleoside-diphosphate-sugar epimerase
MMRVLVTGATGFIGRPLVASLAGAGYHVVAAARQKSAPPLPPGVSVATLSDLAAPVAWETLLDGIDVVIHLAGIAHIGAGVSDAQYDRINHRATAELARAARRAAVKRLVFMSSVRAQSGPAADHILTETDEARPTDAYGRSKLAAEAAVRESGVDFTILRPVLIYGTGVKGNLAALARLAALPLPLPFASFHNLRSLLSRDNLVSAMRFVLENPASRGETFVVADPEPVSLAEMIASLRRGLGRRPGLLPLSPRFVQASLQFIGADDLWQRLGGSLVAPPAKLVTVGWKPHGDTRAELARMARALSRPRDEVC